MKTMKHYVIGGLVGFLLAVPFTAFGQQIASMVGKQVKGEHAIIVDGKTLSKKAISIDGTTYAPLRSVADAVEYDIAFTDNTVILSNPSLEGDLVDSSTAVPTTEAPTSATHFYTLDTIDEAILSKEGDISATKGMIISLEEKGFDQKAEEMRGVLQKRESELQRLKEIKSDLQAEATAP